MKKLLLISPVPPPYSGMERATQLLLDCRVSKNFEILLVDSSAKSVDNDTRGQASFGKILRLIRQTLRISWLSISKRPDVALTPLAQNKVGFIKCGLFILAAAIFGVPVVTWMGGSAFGEFYKSQNKFFQYYIRLCLKNVSHIIIRGKQQAQQFDGLFAPDKLTVVYNPRLPKVGEPNEAGSTPKPFRILYMSLISKAKGALDALEAIGMLRQQGFDIKATLAGDLIEVEKNIMHVDSPESTSEAVNRLMDKYDLHEIVDIPGFLGGEDKERAYATHDVFLFPSYSEGAPFSILEAVSQGMPIVATPVGNLPELLDDNRDILYCGYGNPASIADKIKKLIEEPDLMQKLPRNADEHLEKRCSIAHFEEAMTSLLDKSAR